MQIEGDRKMPEVFGDITAVLDKQVALRDPMENYCKNAPYDEPCRVYDN